MSDHKFEIFLATVPGLEQALFDEAKALGLPTPKRIPGGVSFDGGWPDVWRANLCLRGATRVLARIGSFPVFHLAQLDKRARKFPWADVLPTDKTIRVETTCKRSKIYHDRAATQRIERALTDVLGIEIASEADITLKVRIEDNLCTFSVDTSGESLHKRGHKTATGKAPMRETLAALFLRQMGYDGAMPVVDPMCGSGTFVIEAAEWASGLFPGRSRAFAFEAFSSFDADAFEKLKASAAPAEPELLFFGSDRNDGAVQNSRKNAENASVSGCTQFKLGAISDLQNPGTSPGIVMVNPPYGTRIGEKKLLFAVYGSLGKVLLERFSGWRVGIVTSDGGLAKATGLDFAEIGPPISHGGLKIKLYQTAPLP